MRNGFLVLACAAALSGCTVGDPSDNAVAGDGLAAGEGDTGALPARVCGGGSTLKGVDVSFYQENVDWPRVAAAGYTFAFVRVSDGLNYPDSKFQRNWSGVKAAGMVRGAYQFFRPNQDAIAQADLLINAVGTLAPGDLPPVIDVEATGGLGPSSVSTKVGQWVDRVRTRLGVEPIVYTGKYFWEDNVGTSTFKNQPLWVAQYTSASCPDLPSQWSSWAFWQYTDSGSVPGIPGGVDTNRFNGTRADLDALAKKASQLPIEVYWARRADGGYDLRALAPQNVTKVEYRVDGYVVGTVTRAAGNNFPTSYTFSSEGTARRFEVHGFDAQGREIGLGVGAIDVTAGTAVYIKQLGDHLYEVGLERAGTGVASLEVRIDGYLLTDATTGMTRTSRLAVRSSLSQLGSRTVKLTTYNADGSARGSITRTFDFQ